MAWVLPAGGVSHCYHWQARWLLRSLLSLGEVENMTCAWLGLVEEEVDAGGEGKRISYLMRPHEQPPYKGWSSLMLAAAVPIICTSIGVIGMLQWCEEAIRLFKAEALLRWGSAEKDCPTHLHFLWRSDIGCFTRHSLGLVSPAHLLVLSISGLAFALESFFRVY